MIGAGIGTYGDLSAKGGSASMKLFQPSKTRIEYVWCFAIFFAIALTIAIARPEQMSILAALVTCCTLVVAIVKLRRRE